MAAPDSASFKVENGVIKFYFATGKADLATGAEAALAEVAKGVAAGKRAVISGYTDAPATRRRTRSSPRRAPPRWQMPCTPPASATTRSTCKRPEAITGTGDHAEARRVEVTLH